MPKDIGVHKFYTSKVKSLLGTFVYGFVAFAALGFSGKDGFDPSWGMLFGLIFALVFGAGMIRSVLLLIKVSPVFIIDDEGIIDNISGLRAGRVTWDDIDRIDLDINRIGLADYSTLEIFPKNLEALIANRRRSAPFIKKIFFWLDSSSISLSGFEMKGKLKNIADVLNQGLAS